MNLLTAIALLAVSGAHAATGQWQFEGVGRVVAISDIHGAYAAMVRTLQSADVVDAQLAWSGGDTHLVIVGDILDRGPDSRQAMDLVMRLESEAAAAGGRVHVLIGNHEAMNLIGDLRYVARGEYAAFAAEESADERRRWFEAYVAKRGNGDPTEERQRLAFEEQFPPGFFAHRQAFAADGKYGSWLLSKPLMIVIDGTAFVHGGVSPMIAELGLSGVNDVMQGEMVAYVRQVDKLVDAGLLLPTDAFYDHPDLLQGLATMLTTDAEVAAAVADVMRLSKSDLHSPAGPLWYRGNVACTVLTEAERLDAALAAVGARRVVIGHTPTRGRRVLQRFDGRVLEVDTGMLNSFYEGHGNALLIAGDALAVINESGEQSAGPAPHPRHVGQRPKGLDTAGIEALLEKGEVVAENPDTAGRHIVSVSDGERRIDAVFDRQASRGFFPEVAAYRLDRLLGLDMVPVAVKRKLGRKEGSLRFLPPATIDEARRNETGQGGGAMCPLSEQWESMVVFDALIFNEARFAGTIRYDPTTWQLILTAHSRAFGTSKGRPRQLADLSIEVRPGWRQALATLTEELLEERFGDVLDRRRQRALLARRDNLLEPPAR